MSRLMGFVYSLRSMLRRSSADRETADEIAYHIEQQTAKHVARGLSPDAARATAVAEFGGAGRWREETADARAGRLLDHFGQDARYAVRVLRRHRTFTAVAVLTLAVGIGGTTAAVTIVDHVLLRPLPYPKSDELVSIVSSNAQMPAFRFSEPNRVDFVSAATSYQSIGGALVGTNTIGTGDDITDVTAAQVSGQFFETLGTPPLIGRVIRPGDALPTAPSVVVLGFEIWQRLFGGDRGIIGRPITVATSRALVVGIMPPHFDAASGAQLWMACRWCAAPPPRSRASLTTDLVARLKPGVTIARAEAEANVIGARIHAQYPNAPDNQLLTVHVRPLLQATVANARGTLLGLTAFVGFILLIGCANLASANLARNMVRRHELALRSALGAARRRIVAQLTVESLVLSLMGGAMGLVLAAWCVRIVAGVAAASIPRTSELSLGLDTILVALAICIVTTLMIGVVPALQLSRRDLRLGLASQRGGDHRSRRLRNILIAAEVALSLVLTVGASLTVRSLQLVQRQPVGVETRGLMTVQPLLNRRRYKTTADVLRFDEELMRRLNAVPGVTGSAIAATGPLGIGWMGFIEIEGRPVDSRTGAQYNLVSETFPQTVALPLLQGRWFNAADDSTSEPVTVIDRSMADHYWPGENPIGKRFRALSIGGDTSWLRIIGIVGTMRTYSLENEPSPTHYVSVRQRPSLLASASIVLRSTSPASSLIPEIRRALTAVDPQTRAKIQSFSDLVQTETAERRTTTQVLTSFALVALLLAAIGIYGVLSYSVAMRTREIGVRIALGAARRSVIRGTVREVATPVAIGIAIGLAGTVLLSRAFEAIVFGVRPTSPAILLTGTLVMAALALSAALIPARRASRVDPIVALRAE